MMEVSGYMRWMHLLMNGEGESVSIAGWFKRVMFAIISVNVIDIIIKTIPDLPSDSFQMLTSINHVSAVIFAVEYLSRVWVSPLQYPALPPVKARLSYMATPLGIIDLFALVPYTVPLLIPHIEGYDRLYIFFQLFILLKLIRYSLSLQVFVRVFKAKRHQLGMVLYLVIFLLLVASILMYYIEHAAQPDKFSSIPATMWWGVITLSTVGYGDMVPITPFGRMLGSVVALLGIGIFALPAGILASGFYEEFSSGSRKKVVCPECKAEFTVNFSKSEDETE